MAAKLEQTRRKVIFGRYMQSLRERCQPKITQDAAAKAAHVASSTVTRMEGGYTVPGFLLASTLLGIYGASEEERAKSEQLRQAASTDTTRVEHAADMSAKYRAFRRDENEATRTRTLDTVVVPGLLQTSAYAGEIWNGARRLSKSKASEAEMSATVIEERLSRQALLTRREPPLILHALIDECALTRLIGGPDVTVAQLDHILSMMELQNVTVQVIPRSAGAYGPLSGPMILFDYDTVDEFSIAYLEYVAGGETVDNVDDVASLSAVWDEVRRSTPTPKRSAEIIRNIRNSVRKNE